MIKRTFKIIGDILYFLFLFSITGIVVVLSGIFVLGLSIRDKFYTLIGKKKNNNG